MEKYFIYELTNAGIPFYVGITDNPAQRLFQHKTFYGDNIAMNILAEHDGDYQSGLIIEIEWIKKHQDAGYKLDNRQVKFNSFPLIIHPEGYCQNCGEKLINTPGKRKKFFCNVSCRSSYWQKQKKATNGMPIGRPPGRPKKETIPLPDDYVRFKNIKAVTADGKKVSLFKPANQPVTDKFGSVLVEAKKTSLKPTTPPLEITPMTYNDYLREALVTKDKESFKYRVRNDKKLNSRQRDMIYSKLKP